MMTRNEVFALVDGERNYQDWVWEQRYKEAGVKKTPDSDLLPEDWLVYIKGYYDEAVKEAAHCVEVEVVLDIIRKLAGLCVACMEVNGCWLRRDDGVLFDSYPAPVERSLVYHAISCERAYQQALSELRTDGRFHSVNGYLVMFGDYLNEAFKDWTRVAGHKEAMQAVGKLAGIAVHCMEDHGAPRRDIDVKVSIRDAKDAKSVARSIIQSIRKRLTGKKPCKNDR